MLIYLIFFKLLISPTNSLENPIIGILSQESYLIKHAFPEAHSFIIASYVKYLEAGGARTIPIWIGQDDDYYKRVVNYTNGILFPGGGTYFNETKGYADAANKIYHLAVDLNEKGVYYPLLGICLGMQVLAFSAANGIDLRVECSAKNMALPISFTKDYEKTNLFHEASMDIIEGMKDRNMTYHYHQYCLMENHFRDNELLKNWTVIGTSKDKYGIEFVSIMEHKNLPFYGVQYHPEKPIYEFHKANAPRGILPVKIGQYLTNFFVNESRKNNNTFPSIELEYKSIFYRYNPTFSALNTSYEQIYLFNEDNYNVNLL